MSIIQAAGSGEASTSFYSHTIDQSLRFEDGDSAYLSHTPPSAGNRKTFTFSCWVKRGNLGEQAILDAYSDDSNRTRLMFDAGNRFQFFTRLSGADHSIICNAVCRDLSAWYHVVYAVDTTQSTASNRVKIYINGESQTFTGTGFPDQNEDTFINHTVGHSIGSGNDSGGREIYFDGYLAEINVIDGTALTPASFGETKDGVWIPKKYSGSYGNEGFYLTFQGTGTAETTQDSTAQTNIGDDQSGNGNNWAVNALVASDVVLDSPTNNFATLNPLSKGSGTITFSEGNLKSSTSANLAAAEHGATFTIPKSGKWYWEASYTGAYTNGAMATMMGIMDIDTQTVGLSGNHINNTTGEYVAYYSHNNGVYVSNTLSNYTGQISTQTSAVVGFALDMDNAHLWIHVNGTYINGTPDFSDGTNKIASPTKTKTFLPFFGGAGGAAFTWRANFGQDSAGISSAQSPDHGIGTFEYDVPADYNALCTSNLPDITIGPGQSSQADDHFNTVLWTGTGSGGTRAISGVGFSPDWVWAKNLTEAYSHVLYDSVRGAGNDKELQSNDTAAEGDGNNNQYGYLSAFDSDGFTSTSGSEGDANNLYFNESSKNYSAWNWLAGTAFSASVGSISTGPDVPSLASSGQVNTKAGFSIVSYSGSNSAATFAHGLSNAPELVIIKQRNNASFWATGFAVPDWTWSSDYIQLQDDAQKGADGGSTIFTAAPSSTVVSIGGGSVTSTSGKNLIAYCFHSVEGYSKIGQYEGNNLADGTFVHTGFRPAFLLVKNLDAEAQWLLLDNKRDPYNVGANYTSPDIPSAFAAVSGGFYDLLSNGFKWRLGSGNLGSANAANTYVYYAVAEQPFKFANAR